MGKRFPVVDTSTGNYFGSFELENMTNEKLLAFIATSSLLAASLHEGYSEERCKSATSVAIEINLPQCADEASFEHRNMHTTCPVCECFVHTYNCTDLLAACAGHANGGPIPLT